MAFPQGIVNFSGIDRCVRFQMTMTGGVSPSVATLTTPPLGAVPRKISDLAFSYGPVNFKLRSCLLDSIQVTVDGEGRTLWEHRIFDRRWLWREVEWISGYYNVRTGAERDRIIASTERTPQQLARLCLEAMGERGYDVGRMPNDARPAIEWDYINPAEALAELCDELGCTVSLGLDDRVHIHRTGIGAALPNGGITFDVELDPPDIPGEITIIGDRTRFQVELHLEAVGLDTDGVAKPIDELSYRPRAGETWDIEFNHERIADLKARELARQTVFRWYRVRAPQPLGLGIGKITDLWEILPLHTEQVEKWIVENEESPRPPWVYGSFWEGMESVDSTAEVPEPKISNDPEGLYRGGFTLDASAGIVKFSNPVYRFIGDDPIFGIIGPANLSLRTAISVRDRTTRAFERFEYARGKSKPRKPVRHEDIRLSHYFDFERGRAFNNQAECDAMAEHYLQAELQKYQLVDSGSVDYAGFVPMACDGAIRQVTWSITDEGFCLSRLSRNKEESAIVMPYKERRLYERLLAAQAAGRAPRRAMEDDDRLGKGR